MAARWKAPAGEQWAIAAGHHRATVVEVGGGIREYMMDGEPVVDGYPEDELPRRGAGQVLAPWPNRIADGAYTFAGEDRQLPINETDKGNAIHGLTRWLAWRRVEHTPESVTVSCTLAPQPGYPHALELVTRWSVGRDGLRADHTAFNLGSLPAPFGLGVHPYVRVGSTPVSALTLRVPAAIRLLVNERMLPTGSSPVDGTSHDFRGPRQVGDTVLDVTYGRLSRDSHGEARVSLTEGDGRGVEVWLGAAFHWLQVFNAASPAGPPGASLAVEPMSCPPDAFRSGADLVTLGGGERWTGSWGIQPLR